MGVIFQVYVSACSAPALFCLFSLSVGFFRCVAYNLQELVRALCAVPFLKQTAAEVKVPKS